MGACRECGSFTFAERRKTLADIDETGNLHRQNVYACVCVFMSMYVRTRDYTVLDVSLFLDRSQLPKLTEAGKPAVMIFAVYTLY